MSITDSNEVWEQMKVNCIDKEVREVLESGYYCIPRFQRPFSWDRENIEDFWGDTIVNSDSDYFIGSIVTYKGKPNTRNIVDGQQRLTTITMILCGIRNFFKQEKFEDLAKGVHKLIERPDISNNQQYVLQTETSYPFFHEHIQKFGIPDNGIEIGEEEKRLKAAFDLICGNIKSVVDAAKGNTSLNAEKKADKIKSGLSILRDRILSLKLIFIELDNEDDAYLIFETLNTRGKDLNVADLVKNHLTKLIRTRNANVDLPRDRWEKILAFFEESESDLKMDTFLHHYWLSTHDFITSKRLFKAVRKHVDKANAKQFLSDIQKEANHYREIYEPSYKKWSKSEAKIQESLEALRLFNVQQPVPMLLSILREYHASRLSLKHTIGILSAIEKFHFIFTAVTSQRSSGGISFMYAFHARSLMHAGNTADKIKVVNELKLKLRSKIPSYNEFEASFYEIGYSDVFTKLKKLVQYILGKISTHLSVGIVPDMEKMTIEHLLSQNSSDSLLKPDDKDIARIGNLIYTNSTINNTKLHNKSFADKKAIILNSNIPIDEYLKKASKWDTKAIEGRTKYLAKLAFEKIWRI